MRILNPQARLKYFIKEGFEAGIVLTGFEVKSVRAGKVDLSRSFARILGGELFLINAFIYPFQQPTKDYQPSRSRKLLIHKSQLHSLVGKLSSKGLTLVPLLIYEKRNLIKVEIGIASQKKKVDRKKEIIKQDEQRQLEQETGY